MRRVIIKNQAKFAYQKNCVFPVPCATSLIMAQNLRVLPAIVYGWPPCWLCGNRAGGNIIGI